MCVINLCTRTFFRRTLAKRPREMTLFVSTLRQEHERQRRFMNAFLTYSAEDRFDTESQRLN